MPESRQHHITIWEQRQMVTIPGGGDRWIMHAFGWTCAGCKTWGAEEAPKRREHAIERHVAGMSTEAGVDHLERLIARWWEEEADYTASCSAPDPALCNNHVFEEAVRVDGEIVACTVHGDRLARSLAGFLAKVRSEEEARIREDFRRAHPIGLAAVNHPEAFLAQFRIEREGNWPANEHRQGCGAGKDPSKACICPSGRAVRLRREHLAGSHRPYCEVIRTAGGTCDCGAVEAAAKLAHDQMDGGCTCISHADGCTDPDRP